MIVLQRPPPLPAARACLPCPSAVAKPTMRRGSRRNWTRKAVVVTSTSSSSPSTSSPSTSSNRCSLKRTLLVAVDESKDSHRAVLFALDHMYRPGDTIHLVHIVARVKSHAAPSGALYYAPPLSCSPDDAKAALEKQARAFITREFAGLIADRALPPEALAIDVVNELGVTSAGETVGEAIVRVAEEIDAAALVVLSHQKKKIEEIVWGSVSKEVASRTKRPVVLVH